MVIISHLRSHTFLQHEVYSRVNSSIHPVVGAIDAAIHVNEPPLLGDFQPAPAPLPAERNGYPILAAQAVIWTVIWVALFYILAWVWPRLKVINSSYAFENDRFWCARQLAGLIHATFVGVVCLAVFLLLLGQTSEIQFASSNNLGFCAVDPAAGAELRQWQLMGETIGFVGVAFVAFTFSDVIISLIHGLAGIDYYIHHTAFICAGVIIRTNCMLPLNASILMAMEVSSPFLNWLLLFRHREGYSNSVMANTIFFMATFIVTRVFFNTYGAVIFWVYRQETMPPTVPAWEVWFLIIAVSVGVAVQFFWLQPVVSGVMKIIMAQGYTGKKEVEKNDDVSPAEVAKDQITSEKDELPAAGLTKENEQPAEATLLSSSANNPEDKP